MGGCAAGAVAFSRLPAGRKRYLNSSHFVTKHHYQNLFVEKAVDRYILDDPALYYRVLDLTGSTFSDAYQLFS